MEPVIRPFAPGDLERLQDIRRVAFAPVFASFREIVGDEIWELALANSDAEQAAHLGELCTEGSAAEMLVVELDGVLVAFAAVTVDEATRVGEIGLNAVHPDHAGQGIGTRLYEAALDRMRARGARVATVGTGGDPSHAPARRAYEKAGFGPAIPSVYLYRTL